MTAKATQRAFFSILLLIVTLAFFWLIGGFIQPIFWATVLGIVFFPAYNSIKGRLGGRETVASGVTLVVVLLVAIIPITWIVSVVASQAAGLYANILSGEIDVGAVFDWFNAKLPVVVSWLESIGIDAEKMRAMASSFGLRVSQFLANILVGFGQNIVRFSLMFTLMLYILFFVFRDGRRILDAAILVVPLDEDKKQELLMRFAEVSRATIKGTAIIGVVQGAIGGIAFAALGIPSAALWGVLMVLLSVVPAVGPALVWMPATLYFFAVGQYVQGSHPAHCRRCFHQLGGQRAAPGSCRPRHAYARLPGARFYPRGAPPVRARRCSHRPDDCCLVHLCLGHGSERIRRMKCRE